MFHGPENFGPVRKWNLLMVIAIGSILFAQHAVGESSPWFVTLDRYSILCGVGLGIGVVIQMRQNRKH